MTKYNRYVPKAFLSPLVNGMVVAQILPTRYAIPPHFKPWPTVMINSDVMFIKNCSVIK